MSTGQAVKETKKKDIKGVKGGRGQTNPQRQTEGCVRSELASNSTPSNSNRMCVLFEKVKHTLSYLENPEGKKRSLGEAGPAGNLCM